MPHVYERSVWMYLYQGGKCWYPAPKNTDRCWTGAEQVLSSYWTGAEQVLSRCWTGAEQVLNKCWGAGGTQTALSPLIYIKLMKEFKWRLCGRKVLVIDMLFRSSKMPRNILSGFVKTKWVLKKRFWPKNESS
jgi:hypothetical protein